MFGGWVKTGREAGAGSFAFLEVSDGTSAENLQVGGAACPSSEQHHACSTAAQRHPLTDNLPFLSPAQSLQSSCMQSAHLVLFLVLLLPSPIWSVILQVKLPKEVAQAYALAQLQANEGDAERALSLFTATGTAVLVQGKLTTTPEGTKQVCTMLLLHHALS